MALRKISKSEYDSLQNKRTSGLRSVSQSDYEKIKAHNAEYDKILRTSTFPLQIDDGTSFGNVSADVFKAIKNGEIDKYTPKNEEEKSAIEKYTNYINQQTIEIPISETKTIKIKVGTANAIDDFVKNNTEKNKVKKAQQLDDMVKNLNLTPEELEGAKSYAGLKKLSIASGADKKGATPWKVISQPFAEYGAGALRTMRGAKQFVFDDGIGGLLTGGETPAADMKEYYDKYYSENPDKLGDDLLNGNIHDDYISEKLMDKSMEWYEDNPTIWKYISKIGFGMAGEMAGAAAASSFMGLPQIFSGAGNAVKTTGVALNGTKAGNVIGKVSKVVNAAPNIKNATGTGLKAVATNFAANQINKLSIGSIAKFMNPLENPTTFLMGANAMQDKYRQLRNMGYDKETSKANALFTGYVNTITEKMGYNGTPDSMSLLKKLSVSKTKNAGNLLKQYLKSNVGEGLEEIYANVFERAGDYFQRIGYEDENGNIQQRKFFGKNGVIDIGAMGESFLGGFVGGAVMGSTGMISSIANSDIETVRAYADEIKEYTDKANAEIIKSAKKAGIEDVKLPKTPDWDRVTVQELNDYLSETVSTYNNILNDERVVKNDNEVIDNALTTIDSYLPDEKNTNSENKNRTYTFNRITPPAKQFVKNKLKDLIAINRIYNDKTPAIDISDFEEINRRAIEDEDAFFDFSFIQEYANVYADSIKKHPVMAKFESPQKFADILAKDIAYDEKTKYSVDYGYLTLKKGFQKIIGKAMIQIADYRKRNNFKVSNAMIYQADAAKNGVIDINIQPNINENSMSVVPQNEANAVYDSGNVMPDADAVNVNVEAYSPHIALDNTDESGIINNNNITQTEGFINGETQTGTETEPDTGGQINVDDRRIIEGQTGNGTQEMEARANRASDQRSEEISSNSRNSRKLEKNALEKICENEKFQKLSITINSELTNSQITMLYENTYQHDNRFDEGYEFPEMLTYDILTGKHSDLYDLFSDEISEYFNTSIKYNMQSAVKNNVNNGRIETKNSEQRAVNNGGKVFENDNRLGEASSSARTDTVSQQRNTIYSGPPQTAYAVRRGQEEVGERAVERKSLEEICDTDKFIKLKLSIRNELSSLIHNQLYEKYRDDTRITEGYDFDEIYTYDLLTNSDNELRDLFSDEISEYFNTHIDVKQDITGKDVAARILKATRNSVVKSEHGQLIPVYHGTGVKFDIFIPGDIGIHFGSFAQAKQRATDKGIENPIYIKAYLNITNPLIIDGDFPGWNAFQIAKKLHEIGILSTDVGLEFQNRKNSNNEIDNRKLVEILRNKGFDGIIYENNAEATEGKSYIVFGNEQIFRINNETAPATETDATDTNTESVDVTTEMPTNADNESTTGQQKTVTETTKKKKIIRAKKADWASHDVIWYTPNGKTIIAYSTVSASDLIGVMADENPEMTISELHDAINYDEEAKKVLQAYINNGFGDEIANNHFSYENKTSKPAETKSTEETATDIQTKEEAVNNQTENVELTDKCSLEYVTNKKTNQSAWVVSVKERLTKEQFAELAQKLKTYGVRYSRFIPTENGNVSGFVFKERPTDDAINVINGFYEGSTDEETTPVDEVSISGEELYKRLKERYGNATEDIRESYTHPISNSIIKDLVNIAFKLKSTKVLTNHDFTGGHIVDSENFSSLDSETLLWVMSVTKNGFADIANVMIDVVNEKVNAPEAFNKIKNLISNNLAYQKITKTGLFDEQNEASDVFEESEDTEEAKSDGKKEIDVNTLFGAVKNAKVGDEIKLSDYEKQTSDEHIESTENVVTTDNNNKEDGNFNKKSTSQSIADFVKEKLSSGNSFSFNEIQSIANEVFGGTMADNAYTVKDLYDAMELGINQHILSLEDVSLDGMLEILSKIPTQTKRTSGQDNFQQFSTPPSIAYLASYAANINSDDVMLEPSAGIGGIALFAKREGATVHVNELDKRRLDILKNMPFDAFYNENAEQIDNILGNDLQPDVIVMNPPFSSSASRNVHDIKIGAKHIEEALKILKPNGRLVAIVGRGMTDNAPAFSKWWKDIKSKYNVVANFGINGKNYNKYGTNFDIQLLVIDKNGPTEKTDIAKFDDLHELKERLEVIRNGRPGIVHDELSDSGKTTDNGGKQQPGTTTREKISRKAENNSESESVVSDTDSRKNSDDEQERGAYRRTDGSNAGTDGDVTDRTTDVDTESSASDRRGIREVGNRSEDVQSVSEQTEQEKERDRKSNTENDQSQRVDDSDKAEPVTDNADVRGNGRTVSSKKKKTKKTELTDSIFETYQTQPLTVKGAKPHPSRVSESAAMAAVTPPPLTYIPNLPKNVVEDGVLSDVQIEAISYAGQAHSQKLPDGTTKGFFIGDGTGIGKGRTAAGIILDNFRQGRKKAIWVSMNESLMHDARRDVNALFGENDLLHLLKGEKGLEKSLAFEEGILYASYSTLAKGVKNKNGKNLEAVISWLGEDFEGVIIFDESHNMKNSGLSTGTFGKVPASGMALMGLELQKRLPNARFIYSSATGATEVENLRYAERLGLWGEGTAFRDGNDFIAKIKAGGIAAMEVVASDMKNNGVYLSRNISYDDVQYGRITHKLTRDQKKIYDELARAWQIVFENAEKAMEATGQERSGQSKRQVYGEFWSNQQRFFNQIISAMQVPSVIKDIEKQLEDGKSCVIQLTSTNEAAQKREMERLQKEGLTLDEFDLTPKEVLMNYLENAFPVQQYEETIDDSGNKIVVPVTDSEGKPVLNREAVRLREEMLDRIGSLKMPSSAIDMIINYFGTDIVAENTGRSSRVIETSEGLKQESLGKAAKLADVEAFQNGKKRIMIFSKAGGTGKSYHADRTAKNQQQRVHYLLEAGWQADAAVQGFGRSHRSNQANAPIFKLVTTDLKGQMRFISTIAKRLDQLGALTKGQRQAGSQGIFSAEDNLENSLSGRTLEEFYKALAKNRIEGVNGMSIIQKLGLGKKIFDRYGNIDDKSPELREVSKFLNRILVLETDVQNLIFDVYSENLRNATEEAISAGTFDTGVENFKADSVVIKEIKTINTNESTGAETHYYQLEAKHKIKPITVDNLGIDKSNFVGFFRNKNNGNINAIFKIGTKTDDRGRVLDNYRFISQVGNSIRTAVDLNNAWEKLSEKEGIAAWDEALKKVPEYRVSNVHLIKDNLLSVWDKLPGENVRIQRLITDDGEMLIGRVIRDDMIDGVLHRFDIIREKAEISTNELLDNIHSGDVIVLDNNWMISKRRVSGEIRIELIGPDYLSADRVKNIGVFSERIGYQTRFFIPTQTNTEKILKEVLKISPVKQIRKQSDIYRSVAHGSTNKTSSRNYSYNALISKPDMPVTILNPNDIYDSDGKIVRKTVIEKGIENVRQKNNPKNNAKNSFVYVKDIDRDVMVTIDGLRHGMTRKPEITAIATLNIGDILENSIRVNELNARENTSGGYVLLGIAADKKNNYYPVRIIVNNYSVDNIEVLDVLYAVNAKKKDQSPNGAGSTEKSVPLIKGLSLKNQSSNEAELPADAVPPIKGSFTISISQLLDFVKNDFSDVLSDDVLSNLKVGRKESSLSGSVRFKETYEEKNESSIYDNAIDYGSPTERWRTDSDSDLTPKTVKSVSEIINKIRKDFGIPISTGNVRGRGVQGTYNRRGEAIRTRISNDLPTAAHELGHHLDNYFGFSDMPEIQEVISGMDKDYLANYPAQRHNAEAVAEFTRMYLRNRKIAQNNAPEFYEIFINTLASNDLSGKNALEMIDSLADEINTYMSLPAKERYSKAVTSSKKGRFSVISDFSFDKLYMDFVDSFDPIYKATKKATETLGNLEGSKNAWILATNSLNAASVASNVVNNGMTDLDGNTNIGKSLMECLSIINDKDFDYFSDYLVMKHAMEWIKPKDGVTKKRVYGDESLEDAVELEANILEIEENHPEFIEAAENIYEYQRNIMYNFLVKTGVITNEVFKTLNDMYDYYVPFYRMINGKNSKGQKAKATFANQRNPLRRAKGSGADIINPIESIIANTEKFVKIGMRNRVMQTMAYYADTVDDFANLIEHVSPDMMPRSVSTINYKELIEDALFERMSDSGEYNTAVDVINEILTDSITEWSPIVKSQKGIVTVLRDGQADYYQVHDDLLYESLAELTPAQLGTVCRISQAIMTPMKLLTTQNNPVFALTNAARDFQTAYKNSDTVNNIGKFTLDYFKAFAEMVMNSEDYKQYKALGGGHSSELNRYIDGIHKNLRKAELQNAGTAEKLFKLYIMHPLHTVAMLNDIVEGVPRFAEFKRNSGDVQSAIAAADDITTNFKRSGKKGKQLNSIFMYSNAAIQGLDKGARSFTRVPKGKIAKRIITKYLSSVILMSLIQALWNKKDEEGYKNLSTYTKNNNFIFSIGDGKFLKIPKPRELAMFNSIAERALEKYMLGNEDAFYDLSGYICQQIIPPFLPEDFNDGIPGAIHSVAGNTILGAFVDIGFNKDFKGTPIVSKSYENLPEGFQYNAKTSALAKFLGEKLWVSPFKIDHVISDYTGIIGQVNKAITVEKTEGNVLEKNIAKGALSIGLGMLKNKFVSDSNYSTDRINMAYDNRDIAKTKMHQTQNPVHGIRYEKYYQLTDFISEYNKLIKAMPADEQSKAKSKMLNIIDNWNFKGRTSDELIVEHLSGEGGAWIRKGFDAVPSATIEQTKNKTKYTYTMTPQQYTVYVNDYLNQLDKQRTAVFKSAASKNLSNAEIIEMLLTAESEMRSELRKTYINKIISSGYEFKKAE